MAGLPQWEYRVLSIGSFWTTKDEKIEARLNELGLEGWEMVGFQVTATDSVRLVVKRLLTETNRRRRTREQIGV
jgi:hypothetical protein